MFFFHTHETHAAILQTRDSLGASPLLLGTPSGRHGIGLKGYVKRSGHDKADPANTFFDPLRCQRPGERFPKALAEKGSEIARLRVMKLAVSLPDPRPGTSQPANKNST